MSEPLPGELRAWIESAAGAAVSSSEPIGRGASRRIWALRLESGEELVARIDTGEGPVAGTPLTLAREADVYRALAGRGLPVPELRAVHPDGTALLCERAPGREGFDELPVAARRSVATDHGRRLARLHALDTGTLPLGALAVPAPDPTRADLELWRSIDESRSGASSSPAVAVALERLAASVPAPGRPVLCHGDAGPGNYLHDGQRVTALLDWEFAHLGDAHDDLAWVAVRNQVLRHPIDTEATMAGWREAAGAQIEPGRLEWFRALVLTRMLISCDATLAWAGPDAPHARVQAALQPYLALAVFEALRRAGLGEGPSGVEEAAARATWEGSPIAGVLDDPTHLDDLGALR
jgi:aminoglycoside phosphotransferase (APT) family kinase protein